MTAQEKLNEILAYTGKNISQFSKELGYDRPQSLYDIQKGKTKNFSKGMADKIISVYPEISRSWILADEGEMLKAQERKCDTDGSYEENIGSVKESIVNYDVVEVSAEAWTVIKKQAESLASKDRQVEALIGLLKKANVRLEDNAASADVG